MAAPTRRKSADERRDEILTVAVKHFAEGGYHGTSTEVIAREAGISQPYLFRLFRTKRELFLACTDRACEKVTATFRSAAERSAPGNALQDMGHAYVHELLPDRHALLMLMQGYAAVADPAIQEHVRNGYAEIVEEVERLSGATPEQVWSFFATGMLLNVITALDLGKIADTNPLAKAWTEMQR
jgi:AcrR family transcriptional regulator